MRKLSVIIGSAVLALGLCSQGFGGAVVLETDLLPNLLGGTPVDLSGMVVSDVSDTVVQSEIYNRVYTGPNGLYVYLYQLNNTGTVAEGSHSLERLTLAPFKGAGSYLGVDYGIGYLSGLDGTDGFLDDGVLPEPNGFFTEDTASTEVSFNFRKWKGFQIEPGEHTKVLYVVTPITYEENLIYANVIDGIVVAGRVLGPHPNAVIPEPTAIALLISVIGLVCVGRFRR